MSATAQPGYDTSQIGAVLAVTGATLIVVQVLVYPVLNKRYGTMGLMRRLVILQVGHGLQLQSLWRIPTAAVS